MKSNVARANDGGLLRSTLPETYSQSKLIAKGYNYNGPK